MEEEAKEFLCPLMNGTWCKGNNCMFWNVQADEKNEGCIIMLIGKRYIKK